MIINIPSCAGRQMPRILGGWGHPPPSPFLSCGILFISCFLPVAVGGLDRLARIFSLKYHLCGDYRVAILFCCPLISSFKPYSWSTWERQGMHLKKWGEADLMVLALFPQWCVSFPTSLVLFNQDYLRFFVTPIKKSPFAASQCQLGSGDKTHRLLHHW